MEYLFLIGTYDGETQSILLDSGWRFKLEDCLRIFNGKRVVIVVEGAEMSDLSGESESSSGDMSDMQMGI